jgi:translation initiation factor 3 subunit I
MFNNSTLNVKQFRGQGFMTVAKFSPSGDLLFIADKDSKYVSLISISNNQLVGTYNGHNGVIWHLDISPDSKYMISCSGDMSCIVWDVQSGNILNMIRETGIPKYVSISNDLVAIACDPISKRSKSYIVIYSLDDLVNGIINPIAKINEEQSIRATTVSWLSDELIMATYDNGLVKKINHKLGSTVQETKIHDESIKSICFSNDKTEFLTGSLDEFAKIINVDTLKINKTFKSTVPVNSAIYTPDNLYVILGGGIEAMMVAKTSNNDLTTKIYQVSNEKLYRQITNHFGPLRYLHFNPNESSFATASQDGTVKIHYLVPMTDNDSELELFGLATAKEPEELSLINEIVKIEEINTTSTISDASKTTNKKNQPIEQNYPVGHPLHKSEVKISEYKINSKIEVENRVVSAVKVTNLPDDVDIGDLWEMFEFYGRIENNGIRVKKFYNDTVAFVNYLNIESAQKAIEKCDKKRIGFCIIGVEMTQSK